MSKDEHPIERRVGEVADYDRGDDRRGPAHGLEALTKDDEQQEGKYSRDRPERIRGG
jgi:hypothetical protein